MEAHAADSLVQRWAAVAQAAAAVSMLAGESPVEEDADVADLVGGAQGWRRERAANGIVDLAAIMEAGLAALLAVNARGADPRPAAQALLREHAAAREALLALLRVA